MESVNFKLLEEWSKGRKAPQLELAYLADVSTGTVSSVFRGKCPKTQKVRSKIASALGVKEEEVFPKAA